MLELIKSVLILSRARAGQGAPPDCHINQEKPMSTGHPRSEVVAAFRTNQLTPLFGCLMPPFE